MKEIVLLDKNLNKDTILHTLENEVGFSSCEEFENYYKNNNSGILKEICTGRELFEQCEDSKACAYDKIYVALGEDLSVIIGVKDV